MLERLRIMHELVKDQHFQTISKEEIKKDLKETLEKLAEHFESLIQ
jgi:predicted transcriptional regulator